ncbi:MAG: hypothetical protein IPO21_00625 [Bacteroidales bacterium]|nr:hypothetical protein [Bacteroidales bacterium]
MIFNSKTESLAIPLRKGWNLIGYPFKESSEIKNALSSISSYLEDVKNTDGF